MKEQDVFAAVKGACRASSRPSVRTLVLLVALLAGCGGEADPSRDAIGRMDDTSFDRARGTKSGVNAVGGTVGVDDFEGGFVWVEHTAQWCPPCRAQAPILKRVAEEFPDVTFLVLLTATDDAFQAPIQATAAAWAAQHGLEPELVVAKYRNDTRVIPQHRLFSPAGQLLFYDKGQLPEGLIREVLVGRIPQWKDWDGGGDEASWMR